MSGGRNDNQQGIGRIKNEGDLARFIKDTIGKPGTITPKDITGLPRQFRFARGSTTITGGGTSFASASVTHGLKDGKGDALTPEQIIVTSDKAVILTSVTARDSSTFTIGNRHVDGSNFSNDVRNDWLAIG